MLKFALALGAALVLAAPSAVGADPTNLGVAFICGAERPDAPAGPAGTIIAGVGAETFKVDTANPEAQTWFDQGIRLYHAFYHEPAKLAFAKAAALDPACALCAWGVALSVGPNLNNAISPAETVAALALADHAATLVKPGDARAQALIAALQLRYGPTAPKEGREQAYGHAMDAVFQRFPADDEIGNLAAHALLTPARQDDFSGVPRGQEILKIILARSPDDAAAIHYYIHATEFARHPAEAVPYADRLAGLAPNASHLVHMAAHTFMHVGRYEEVALVDAQALSVDANQQRRHGWTGPLSGERYYSHNYQFGLAGSLMAGDGRLALKYADHGPVAFPAASAPERRNTIRARSLVALGRFAPDRALAVPDLAADPRLVKIYRHYARGEAYAAKRDAAGVSTEAAQLTTLLGEAAKASDTGNVTLATLASEVLAGRAAMLNGRPADAAPHFAKATALQESAFPFAKNFDPPPWWYPVRRSLAAAQLQAGHYAEAAKEANASLVDWPRDALALRVLAEAEAKQGQTAAARTHRAQARREWRGDLAQVPVNLT
ncbi:hypothetical protein [Phenylobacterium sp.]|uniref:hypothetical protein n=1 Tax=Phenylobacterium sp. TaxID=1871053 RepID=UPI0025DE09F6|nr:hypothetical protein [Phenylobacterium sp.]